MITRSWSTDAIRPTEQFAFWHDAICAAIMNVGMRGDSRGPFQGTVTTLETNDLRFTTFRSKGHEVLRTSQHVSSKGEAAYLISLQREGVGRVMEGDRTWELAPGEIGVVEAARPFRITFPGDVERTIAVVPSAMVHARAPWLRGQPFRKIDRSFPFLDLARGYFDQFITLGGDAAERAAAPLVENLCNLVALATAPDGDQRARVMAAGRRLQTDTLLAYLQRHLGDPEMSPRKAAAKLGVSVRTVHERFRELDCSFGDWLLEHRLIACRRMLEDPRAAAMSISAVAYGHGFNDLSHFSRRFKERFAMTPRACRRG